MKQVFTRHACVCCVSTNTTCECGSTSQTTPVFVVYKLCGMVQHTLGFWSLCLKVRGQRSTETGGKVRNCSFAAIPWETGSFPLGWCWVFHYLVLKLGMGLTFVSTVCVELCCCAGYVEYIVASCVSIRRFWARPYMWYCYVEDCHVIDCAQWQYSSCEN